MIVPMRERGSLTHAGHTEAGSKGRPMIDWDSDNWGNGVTYAANGSWVTDQQGDDEATQD